MNEMDLAELLLEATEYPGWSSWCGDIIERLAAALVDAEQKIAEQAETIARIHAMATEDTGMAWWVHQELARILTQTDAARA